MLGVIVGAPAPAAEEDARPLPLVVAVGPELRGYRDWRFDLSRAIGYSQSALGDAVDRRFRLSRVVGWQPRGSSLQQMLEALRSQVPPRPGAVVIGLTLRPVTPSFEWGLSSYREALAVVSVRRLGRRYGRGLAHEIAHIFGAIHVDEPGCVMARSDPGRRLAPVNEALLRLHRDRDFSGNRFPLPPAHLAAALEIYRSAGASDAEALALEARIELESGHDRHALAVAERLVATGTDPQAQMLRGIALRRLGRPEAALDAYEAALETGPRDADLHFNRGVALEARDAAGAERAFREALAIDAGHVRALSSLARLLARTGRADEARSLAQRAVERAPRFVGAQVNLALAQLSAGRPAAALAAARRAVALDGACSAARAAEAAALLDLGRLDGAREAFEAGLALDPASAELHEGLGRVHRQSGGFAEALRQLERALELEPERASAHQELGLVHLDARRHREAAEHFERAAALDPARVSAWVNLAAARLLLGLAQPTEEACRRALELDADAHQALATLGLLRRAQGRLAEALELQERALRLAPRDLDVLSNLADLYLDLGRRREARDLYQRVVAGRPDDGFAHNNLAVLLYRLGDVSGAAAHADRARELGVPVAPAFLRVLNERLASR